MLHSVTAILAPIRALRWAGLGHRTVLLGKGEGEPGSCPAQAPWTAKGTGRTGSPDNDRPRRGKPRTSPGDRKAGDCLPPFITSSSNHEANSVSESMEPLDLLRGGRT